MDVRLPNGVLVQNVPEGTTKDQIKQKAISSGLASEDDFVDRSSLSPADVIPLGESGQDVPQQPQPQRELSLQEKAIGAGEAALTALTGATTGTIGYLAGAARGLGNQLIGETDAAGAQQMAEQGAEMLTYEPRTEAGQRYTQAIGEAVSALPAAAAATPVIMPAITTARQAGIAARQLPTEAASVMQRTESPTPDLSVGAAQLDPARVRQERAAELPVPIQLTKGQATQDFAQQRFERETSKNPEAGAPLRERFTEQNAAISQNIDEMLDITGTQIPETAYRVQTGNKVVQALQSSYEKEKQKVRNAYNVARAGGETQEIIDVSPVATYINANRDVRDVAPVLGGFVRAAEVQEVGSGNVADGTFRLQPMTVEKAEALRQRVNALVDQKNPQDIRQAAQIKSLIDEAQGQASGSAFKSARKMNAQLKSKYENLAVIDQLLDTKGRYNDQRIAAEKVVDRAVIGGTVEDVRNLRRVLTTGGEDGIQAWKEVRASTLRHIRDEITKNVGRDPLGNPLISASQFDRVVSSLDKDGKLDLIFGKVGAEQIKTMRDAARDIYVSQPNAINTSNTASVILAAMDMAASAGTGIPAPVLSAIKIASDKAKAKKLQKKIDEALK